MNPLQPLAAQMAEEEDYDWVYNHAVWELAELRGGWIKKHMVVGETVKLKR